MIKGAISSKTVRSAKSIKSLKSGQEWFEEDKTIELDECIGQACRKFDCPYDIVVVKEMQRHTFIKHLKKAEVPAKYKKITMAPSTAHEAQIIDSDTQLTGPLLGTSKRVSGNAITLVEYYDHVNNLVELSLSKVKDLPRVLIQMIGLIVPYCNQLNKLSIMRSHINKYTIYELQRMLPLSSITEVCLDDSPLPEANYAILLDIPACLRYLSLSRCLINDVACRQIFAKLRYSESNEITLGVLNLSSNHITDKGAKYIGEALRSNRHLRYLNLAGNRITDDGAKCIFNVLVEFPLTWEEIVDKRRKYFNYLRTRHAMYLKCSDEYDSKSLDEYSFMGKKSTQKKKGKAMNVPLKNKVPNNKSVADDFINLRAEMLTEELIGPYKDPFGPGLVRLKNGHSYCIGNFILCYLNLSYNNLTYLSAKTLLQLVHYQQVNKIKSTRQCGLMKVLVDGNNIPLICSELETVNDILRKNIGFVGSRSYSGTKRTSMKISD